MGNHSWKEAFEKTARRSGYSIHWDYSCEDDPWPTNTWPVKHVGRDSAIVAYADWINRNKEKEEDMRIAFGIKKVIFNKPATIVYWIDGTKTVVKCGEKEAFDPEKGLAMAFAKKALGNKGNYYNVFKKNIPEEEKVEAPVYEDIPFKNGDTVVVYEPNKYSGMFDQKIGVIGNIKVYHGHINIGVEFYGAAPNKRSETGLYYFDSSKVRKYSKPIPISPVDPVIACEKCIYADVTIAQYPCNDCCFGPDENRFKHYIEK